MRKTGILTLALAGLAGVGLYSGFLRDNHIRDKAAGHDHTDVYGEETSLRELPDNDAGSFMIEDVFVSEMEADSSHGHVHPPNMPSHSHSVDHIPRQYLATPVPDRVILNTAESPEHSLAVNWRTDTTVTSGFIEWSPTSSGPDFQASAQRIPARMEILRVKHGDEPQVSAHYFSAHITGLTPGKKYLYRVGQGSDWSEWHQVRMPHPDKLAFIYFGDAQNDVKSMWSRVIREAYKTMPEVDFMLHAGDLINRHDHDLEWGEWFYAGNFIHATIPGVMTPGNHEYGKGVVLSTNWRPQFNLPKNGPKGLEETCYVINYSNLKVISLDAEQIDESPHYMEAQARWVDSILTHDPRKWTAVTLHYPLFSTKPNRDNEKMRARFKPIFDKHRVDIVLQGHDHAYGRGMVTNVPSGAAVSDGQSGTMYVVSVSGPKMYDVSNDPWMKRKARNTQLFQIIAIEGGKLTYQAYTASGELYDAFDLIKSGAHKPNKVVNHIPKTPERQ